MTKGKLQRNPPGLGVAWQRVAGLTVLGLACWLVSALMVTVLESMGALPEYGMLVTWPLMGTLACLLFGLANLSLRKALVGAVAGLLGMMFAVMVTFALMFGFLHNSTSGWLGNIAFVIVPTVLFNVIYGPLTFGKVFEPGPRDSRGVVGVFVLAGAVVSVPFALLFQVLVDRPSGDSESFAWIHYLLAANFGIANGLAAGLTSPRWRTRAS